MSTGLVADPGVLDEAYVRLHRAGTELRGGLSNRGPIAADALLRLDHGADVQRWLDCYTPRLEPLTRAALAAQSLPGAIASSTHGLIRTEHVVRALLEQPSRLTAS